MNKYVYVVIKKWFYTNQGIDIAAAIGSEDIRTFSNINKAKEFVENEMVISRINNNVEFEIYEEKYNVYASTKVVKSWNYYQPKYNSSSNIRYGFVIQKQIIE